MSTLHFISHCDSTLLVGIDGKDIRESETSGGKLDDTPYMAIGNDEIEKAPDLPEQVKCPKCGKLVDVKISESFKE